MAETGDTALPCSMQAAGLSKRAVMLGPAASVFPHVLAAAWRKRGWDVQLVTDSPRSEWLPGETPIVGPFDFHAVEKSWPRRIARPWLLRMERALARLGRRRFSRVTGKDSPAPWEWRVVDPWLAASLMSRAALQLRPRFVFGHDAAVFGTATALCRGVPRILFPWGSDIFNTAESWPGAYLAVRRALRSVDLVVPSSATAAEYLVRRFGVRAEKVRPISWGVELDQLRRADPDLRRQRAAKWGLPPDALIVQNCRKFKPHYACFTALDAFLRTAAKCSAAHFLVLGGSNVEVEAARARHEIAAAGMSHRFTLIDRPISLAEYFELASISDVFLSLCPRGDMRSASVLQLAASGAAPVIGDDPEYRVMQRQGFSAKFPDAGSPEQIAAALLEYLASRALREQTARENMDYLRRHEDRETQMDLLLSLIDQVCRRYDGDARGSQPNDRASNDVDEP